MYKSTHTPLRLLMGEIALLGDVFFYLEILSILFFLVLLVEVFFDLEHFLGITLFPPFVLMYV